MTIKGVLFKNESKAGKKYYKGSIEIGEKKYEIVAFDSVSKAGKDYIAISESKPMAGGGGGPSRPAPRPHKGGAELADEIPF